MSILFMTEAILFFGWVAEWSNAPVSKTGIAATLSWVQIPPHPPYNQRLGFKNFRLKIPPIFRLGTLAAHFLKISHKNPQQDFCPLAMTF